MSFVVTLDGPAAAGKSTTARALAERLGFQYVDTGAYYRALALRLHEAGVPPDDRKRARTLAEQSRIEVSGSPHDYHVKLDGEDVSARIRTPEVSELASRIAAIPEVRRLLVAQQRGLRESGPLVGEGRDLGTVVFPDAEVKIFLDADLETRARRRAAELQARGIGVTLEMMKQDLERRDARDRSRADSPLEPAPDSHRVDTSGMNLAEQLEAVLAVVRAHPACPPTARQERGTGA